MVLHLHTESGVKEVMSKPEKESAIYPPVAYKLYHTPSA